MAATNGRTGLNDEQLRRLESLVGNALSMRQRLFEQLFDPRRDIAAECGYPRDDGYINPELYSQLYEREPIAHRVVQVLPKESWQTSPLIYESEDAKKITPFEDAWDSIGSALRGESSWYHDEASSPVWEYLQRADILSGIGSYGVIFLGLDDGLDPRQPVPGMKTEQSAASSSTVQEVPVPQGYDDQYWQGAAIPAPAATEPTKQSTKQLRLLFIRVFPESLAQITRFDSNPLSPRYGQPVEYLLTFSDPREQHSGIGLAVATLAVHWTRVVHIADNLGSSEVFGVPRQRPCLNRLLDLRKLYSGSAEMYWRGAFPGYSLETHPQLGGDVDIDRSGLRDMMEEYSNGLQRYLALMGMSAKSLAPQVVDPSSQIAVQIEAICIQLGIPKRVFMGSERGELASSQDDAAWNDRLKQRQRSYIIPRIIVPFVDRLISLGVLPEPESYSVYWPDLTSQTDADRANVALVRTQAMAQFVGSNLSSLMTPMDYMTRELKYSEEEATSIIDAVEKAQVEKAKESAQQAPVVKLPGVDATGQSQIVQQPPGFQTNQDWPLANNGADEDGRWITLDGGQHVYVGSGGEFSPHGPDAVPTRTERAKEQSAVAGEKEKSQTPVGAKLAPRESSARVELKDMSSKDMDGLHEMFGTNSSGHPDVASCVGALDGARVTVTKVSYKHDNGYQARYEIKVDHPDYKAVRGVFVDAAGKKLMYNTSFYSEKKGTGIGTQVFSDQVANLRARGFDRIETFAAGTPNSKLNGYYTWPRMGYDQKVSEMEPATSRAVGKAFPQAKSVLDIMSTSAGRDWWKKNGEGLEEARFDLKDGSRSMQVHEAYLTERATRKSSQTSNAALELTGNERSHEEIDLNAHEEAALEKAWEKLSKAWKEDGDG